MCIQNAPLSLETEIKTHSPISGEKRQHEGEREREREGWSGHEHRNEREDRKDNGSKPQTMYLIHCSSWSLETTTIKESSYSSSKASVQLRCPGRLSSGGAAEVGGGLWWVGQRQVVVAGGWAG